MALRVRCPNQSCQQLLPVTDQQVGQVVRCAHCGQTLFVQRPAADTPLATAWSTDPAPSPGVPAPTDLPRQIGRFQIVARLGEGSFGAVYRAVDPQLQREVALKVPHPRTLATPEAVKRFVREAQIAAQLRHPHIVPVYEAGADGDRSYIASAFIPGRTLAQAIDAGGMDGRRAATLVRALAEALAYAHERGIVHRDVKPANVLLDEAGQPYLLDFGIAHRKAAATRLTQEGALLGTPAYMAPEQAQGQGEAPLPASDQYALGVILYELLCGRAPFEGPVSAVLFQVIHKDPPAPRRIRPDVPEALEAVCLRAMARHPADRYAGCRELADDLGRWLAGKPVQARPPRRRRRRLLGAGLLFVVAACLTAGWLMQGRHSPAPASSDDLAQADKTPTVASKPFPTTQPAPPSPDITTALHIRRLEAVTIGPDEQRTIEVRVERDRGRAAIDVRLEGLPAGVSAAPVRLVAGETTARIVLKATATAAEARQAARVIARSGALSAQEEFPVAVRVPPPATVRVSGPAGMHVYLAEPAAAPFATTQQFPAKPRIEAPGQLSLRPGRTYRLKLTDLPGHQGLYLYPTMELLPADSRSEPFLSHATVPLVLTEQDLEQAVAGKWVIQVVYLPAGEFRNVVAPGPGQVVSRRLDPGIDPVAEARRRGVPLMVFRLGGIDLELPTEFGQKPAKADRTQVRVPFPERLHVAMESGPRKFPPAYEAPCRFNVERDRTYRLKLSNIPNRPGLDLYPTLEARPGDARAQEFLAHTFVPILLTPADIEEAVGGTVVTKVLYLPRLRPAEEATAGKKPTADVVGDTPDTITGVFEARELTGSLRAKRDPLRQAALDGTILAVFRMSNVDLEAPGGKP